MSQHPAVSFKVNGQPVLASDRLEWTLLRYLREALGLTGTKQACDDEGTCGSCAVLIDGRCRRACLEKVAALDGCEIETIESLQVQDGAPHALVQTVIQDGIFQCGYCAPGALMAAKGLLDADQNPSAGQVVHALSPVLCRCVGLHRMQQSVLRAAAALRGERDTGWTQADTENEHQLLDKVTGKLKYTDDLSLPGMVYGQALRSPLPHARVVRVDTSRAETLPGVIRVLTAKDVPGVNRYGLLTADQPIFCDEVVRYVGDALALVVAETPEQAQAALAAIEVELEPLPVLTSPEAALAPDAPVLHEYLREHYPESPNVLKHHAIRKGDIEQGFAAAAVVLEGDYEVPFVDHAAMELECSIGVLEDNGQVTVYCGSQGPLNDRSQVAAALGVEESKARIAHMYVGGAFGGKEDVAGQVLAAIAAQAVGRPVKVRFTRAESMRVQQKRHAMKMHYKTGATRDGRLVAAEVKVLGDTGAYASTGEAVLFRSSTFACGPYAVPNVKVDTYAIHTNNPTCGAFRGFGGPQVAFAGEVHLQKLIDALGLDPVEFRLRNALELGQSTITGQVLTEDVGSGIRACLTAVKEALDATPRPPLGPGEKLGIGIACAYKNVGLGGGIPDGAGARIALEPDGRFLLRHGAADLGQGSNEAMALIAAQTLGVPLGAIRVHTGDTDQDPHGGMSTASRTTFVSGNAVLEASRELRRRLWQAVADSSGAALDDLELEGAAFVNRRSGARYTTLSELAASGARFEAESRYEAPQTNPVPPKADDAKGHRLHFAYCYGVQAAMVAVHEASGAVRVLKIIAAHDVGKAISRRNCIGQIEGAAVQGLGYALTEAFPVAGGYPQAETFRELGLHRLKQVPELQPILVEDPHPKGPYGAKGMGELALTPCAPAIVNAIHDAVGVWIDSLPVTRDKVLAALRQQRTQRSA